MNPFNCEFVMVGGYWLPTVAGLSRTPVYIGDYDRAYSGVLRTAHVGKARTWRVLLQGVPSEEVPMVEEILRSPEPVGCNVMGVECIASVTEISSVHVPVRRGPNTDWGRMNYEIQIEESWAEHVLPGYTYEYQAFFDTGSFVWNWTDAGQPEEIDVILVAGGGGGSVVANSEPGSGGGGAGGVQLITGIPVSGNLAGSVGAGGAQGENGQDTTLGSYVVIGGGRGGGSTAAGAGGSGGGAKHPAAPGSGTPGQGHAGGRGNGTISGTPPGQTRYGGGGGGGGAGTLGTPGSHPTGNSPGGGGAGGMGIDLLSIGWNYRQTPGVPRFVGGGGGGSRGGFLVSTGRRSYGGAGGVGGGGNGQTSTMSGEGPTDGAPNTGGGAGAGPAAGGSGLVIVRWLVE